MENKKIIGFDLDGVILDHTKMKIKLAGKWNIKLKKEQTSSEILRTMLPRPAYKELKNLLFDHPKYSLMSPLMRGAKAGLAHVKNKVPYFLISRRKDPNGAIKLLKLRGLWPDYFNENNSFFVENIEDKNTRAALLNITHYVDDELRVLEKLIDVENKFLFDPLNVLPHADYCHKIRSWPELIEYLF